MGVSNLISNGIYIFFRLAPFLIIVCLSIFPLMTQLDLKGFIFLIGCFFNLLFTFLGDTAYTKFLKSDDEARNMEGDCNLLGMNDTSLTSLLSIELSTMGYILGNIYTIIFTNEIQNNNIMLLSLIPILTSGTVYFNITNSCFTPKQIGVSLLTGLIGGVIWAFFIANTGYSNLQILNDLSSRASCSQPTRNKYKCTVVRKDENSAE